MKINKKIITGLLLIANINMVFADNYIGGSFGQSEVNVSGFDKPTAYKIYGGTRSTNFGVEAAYHNVGAFIAQSFLGETSTTITGFELSGVGYLPINNNFELFGKFGAFSWENKLNIKSMNFTAKDSGTELTYGIGAQYKVMPALSLRAEYQKFINVSEADISTISLGAAYIF